jgi:hypothetical protein
MDMSAYSSEEEILIVDGMTVIVEDVSDSHDTADGQLKDREFVITLRHPWY